MSGHYPDGCTSPPEPWPSAPDSSSDCPACQGGTGRSLCPDCERDYVEHLPAHRYARAFGYLDESVKTALDMISRRGSAAAVDVYHYLTAQRERAEKIRKGEECAEPSDS